MKNKVLITGGAGFIGSHLSKHFLDNGWEVQIIDDLSTGSLDNIAALRERSGFGFAIDTVLNETVLDRLASQASLIVHLAAAVGVKLIVDRPIHTIETNITGTDAVLRCASRYRVKVLIASTSEVYGKNRKIPFQEDDDMTLGPTTRHRWAYATSKIIDEFLSLAYGRERGLPVVVFRLFNTIGPAQTGMYGMVVPRFVEQALRGEPLTVYGDGTQSRVFCDVEDAAKAIFLLATNESAVGQVFNVGGREEISMEQLAKKIISLTGSSSKIITIPYDEAYPGGFEDMQRRVPDVTKIKDAIGWEPAISLEQTLKRTIAHTSQKKSEKVSMNKSNPATGCTS